MPEYINFYILPFNTSLSFRYLDVQLAVNERLRELPKYADTIFELALWDTYTWNPLQLDLGAPFAWRSPEVENLRLYFKERGSTILALEMDCDYLSYHMDMEDWVLDSKVLTEQQASMLRKDGYYFWLFTVKEQETQNIYLEMLISTLLDLSDGLVFASKGNGERVLLPHFEAKGRNKP